MTRISQWRTTSSKGGKQVGKDRRLLTLELMLVICLILLVGIVYLLIRSLSEDDQTQMAALAVEKTPTLTISPTATHIPTETPLPTVTDVPPSASTTRVVPPSLSPTPSKTPVPVPTRYVSPTAGGSARIEGIKGYSQTLPLSCEASAATDWAAFFGVQIDELDFQSRLPLSDDPEKGFVGNVEGSWGQIPPAPYGVHAAPVALLLRSFGLPAKAISPLSWDVLQGEINAGNPVIVWVVGHVVRGTPVPYISSEGHRITVARYEHTVMVIGYSEDSVTVLDGKRVYNRSKDYFLDSWGVLGNMAIVYRP
ncbi:MAG: C39 family peptidase [Anaerolineales bacterium]|nr:C39 family peptidase [Chloroflexota bacterium]MBL6981750.1 C39 family peptidase [Anaerolineales bacterium]